MSSSKPRAAFQEGEHWLCLRQQGRWALSLTWGPTWGGRNLNRILGAGVLKVRAGGQHGRTLFRGRGPAQEWWGGLRNGLQPSRGGSSGGKTGLQSWQVAKQFLGQRFQLRGERQRLRWELSQIRAWQAMVIASAVSWTRTTALQHPPAEWISGSTSPLWKAEITVLTSYSYFENSLR